MIIFSSITDIHRYVEQFLTGIMIENYNCSYDNLVDSVSHDFRDCITAKGYIYGQEFDESMVSDDEFSKMLEQYEKEEIE